MFHFCLQQSSSLPATEGSLYQGHYGWAVGTDRSLVSVSSGRVGRVLLSVVGWLDGASTSLTCYNTHNSQVDNHGGSIGYSRSCSGNSLLQKHLV
jgi:hypothetical protein